MMKCKVVYRLGLARWDVLEMKSSESTTQGQEEGRKAWDAEAASLVHQAGASRLHLPKPWPVLCQGRDSWHSPRVSPAVHP